MDEKSYSHRRDGARRAERGSKVGKTLPQKGKGDNKQDLSHPPPFDNAAPSSYQILPVMLEGSPRFGPGFVCLILFPFSLLLPQAEEAAAAVPNQQP